MLLHRRGRCRTRNGPSGRACRRFNASMPSTTVDRITSSSAVCGAAASTEVGQQREVQVLLAVGQVVLLQPRRQRAPPPRRAAWWAPPPPSGTSRHTGGQISFGRRRGDDQCGTPVTAADATSVAATSSGRPTRNDHGPRADAGHTSARRRPSRELSTATIADRYQATERAPTVRSWHRAGAASRARQGAGHRHLPRARTVSWMAAGSEPTGQRGRWSTVGGGRACGDAGVSAAFDGLDDRGARRARPPMST